MGMVMDTVFNKEEWRIRRMYESREFAGMKNSVDVQDSPSGDRREVLIAVPTDLFKYVQEVMHVVDTGTLYLYLDHADGVYLFGILDTKNGNYHDLWSYKSLPKWALE